MEKENMKEASGKIRNTHKIRDEIAGIIQSDNAMYHTTKVDKFISENYCNANCSLRDWIHRFALKSNNAKLLRKSGHIQDAVVWEKECEDMI